MKTFSLGEHPLQPEIKLSLNKFNFGIPNVLLIDFYVEIEKIAPGYKNVISKRRLYNIILKVFWYLAKCKYKQLFFSKSV